VTYDGRRLLLIHAHPDDETINNGATMARYIAEGAQVTLLTCTLGELGEILVPELAQLAGDQGDQLGGYRMWELDRAMGALGVTDHRFLAGAGHFHDSGMIGTDGNDAERAFWRASTDPARFEEAVRAVVEVMREVRPQVVVTYDPDGGYGHPDHIMAHRVTMAAVPAAANPQFAAVGQPWTVSKLYWNAIPRSVLQRSIDALRRAGTTFFEATSADDLPMATDDRDVTTCVDGADFAAAKVEAMQAHATQISVDGQFFALSNNLGLRVWAQEYYRLALGELGPDVDRDGRESDLFSGLT
jgi:N-acetyl-1-D-myo-inositol-2-amino-2-deoxy-alpha-D-glucopyranoside deacetylase